MAISASTITASQTLEEFRLEFNKLQSDVNSLQTNATFVSTISFEGSTEDDFETSLTVVDPTADRTQTIQNKSGTLALIGTDTEDTILLDGTDGSSSNAGSAVLMDASASGVDEGDALLFEEALNDQILNIVAPIEFLVAESSKIASDGTRGVDLVIQEGGDKFELEIATFDNILGAPIIPPASGGPQFISPTNDGTENQVLATDGSGNLSFVNQSTGLSVASGDVNNRVMTMSGSSSAIGEANLTFDGSTLTVTGTAALDDVTITGSHNIVFGDKILLNSTDGSTDEGDDLVQNTAADENEAILFESGTADVAQNSASGQGAFALEPALVLNQTDAGGSENGEKITLEDALEGFMLMENPSMAYASDARHPIEVHHMLNSGAHGSRLNPINYYVSVKAKSSHHPYYNTGSSNGYWINGVESPALTLYGTDDVSTNAEYWYKFDQSNASNSGHPLKFYWDAAKTHEYKGTASGTTKSRILTIGTPGQNGAATWIEVTQSTPRILYYQCSNHSLMGNYVQTASKVHNVFSEGEKTQGLFLVLNQSAANGSDAGVYILDETDSQPLHAEEGILIDTNTQRNVINIVGNDGKILNSVAGFAPGAI